MIFHRYRPCKWSKTGSPVDVDIPGHEACSLEEMQFVSITSCEAVQLKFGGAPSSGGGPQVVFVSLPVSDDLKFWFEEDAGGLETSVPPIQSYKRSERC